MIFSKFPYDLLYANRLSRYSFEVNQYNLRGVKLRITVAVVAVAAAVALVPTPVASADENADKGPKVTHTEKSNAKTAVKSPTKLTAPKINLPKPPAAFPKRDQKLPTMPEFPSTAPKWLKNFRSDINKFIKDHPAPGVRWVDGNGNPI